MFPGFFLSLTVIFPVAGLAAETALGVCRASNGRSGLECVCCCGRRQQSTLHPFAVSTLPGCSSELAARVRTQALEPVSQMRGLDIGACRSCKLSAPAVMAFIRHSLRKARLGCRGSGGAGEGLGIEGRPWRRLFLSRHPTPCAPNPKSLKPTPGGTGGRDREKGFAEGRGGKGCVPRCTAP